jgi:hypothetical protein
MKISDLGQYKKLELIELKKYSVPEFIDINKEKAIENILNEINNEEIKYNLH